MMFALLKATLPLTSSGAVVVLGALLLKLKSTVLPALLVSPAQTHWLFAAASCTPMMAPLVTVTGLLEQEPVVTPINSPPLMVVLPV